MASDPSSQIYPPVNHVFVDVENVKTIDKEALSERNLRFHLFLGPQNKKLDVDVVECLMAYSQTVQLIRSPKPGKNALDFVLAYHLGQVALMEPKAFFHIVSKDQGFDALVELLKNRHLKVQRHDDWAGLLAFARQRAASAQATAEPKTKPQSASPPAKPPKVAKAEEIPAEAVKWQGALTKSPKDRPKTLKSLLAHAKNYIGKNPAENAAEHLVEQMKKSRYLSIDAAGKVTYLE